MSSNSAGVYVRANELIKKKWEERASDVELFITLLDSRSNIFVHGTNGCGKTTFVHDCLKLVQSVNVFVVSVDCVEFYSEKLIAITVSQ